MSSRTPIVRSEVIETGFGFYTNEAIRNLSVCQITSPLSQDSLGNYLQSGLYDQKLGTTENGVICITCGQNYVVCPGHCGHIELDVPVYHPMLFSSLLTLLKSKCAYCHKFRFSSKKCRYTLIKLQLLEMGEISNADEIDDLVFPSQVGDSKDDENVRSGEIETKLRIYEERYRAFSKMPSRPRVDPYHKTLQTKTIESFMKTCMAVKKCENCNAVSPKFRKDGFSKIFQKALSASASKPNSALRLELKSGLESLQGDKKLADDSDIEEDDTVDDGIKQPDKYLVPIEVEAQIKLLWRQHTDLLDFIWSRSINSKSHGLINGWEIFFLRACLVPPSRFRPPAKIGGSIAEHPQTSNLMKIIEANERIRTIQIESMQRNKSTQTVSSTPDESNANNISATNDMSKLVSAWITLQNAVNCYMDSAKDPNILANQTPPPGIRQLLERKEGLFRMNMMGKRVNYCCRSVISPDPYIGVNEIGIPVKFAKTLHYPTPVNEWNVKYLRTLVERGPNEYPGANQIETPDGKIIKLEKLSTQERIAKAKLLLASPGIKVYRHLVDGDVLLVNRQPTLHKPGIMSHKARILKHVKEQTLRMNYANCNAYNADFDGDEINCHFIQNELARAEANIICNTDNQYIVPTSGDPLRGLIQDHVASAVKLTCKDTFLTKEEFQQILYVGVCGLPGTEIVGPSDLMIMPPPTIYKPYPLWTGKQIISSLLAHICRHPLPSLQLDGKTKTPATAFGADQNEHVVIFRCGELLCGVIDKAAIGDVSLGLVHAVYELYGAEHAGRLMSALGRMLTFYLQDAGHTCGVEDLILTAKADDERNQLLRQVSADAAAGIVAFINSEDGKVESDVLGIDMTQDEIDSRIRAMLSTNRIKNKAKLDGAMQSVINKSASTVIKACLPKGLERPFLKNSFTLMVSTGAKGSGVNQSQITCFLGQQALEGQRVPIMASGKSLPSFRPYDTSPRAGGFVRDRFLTGVKPQEYYFHCMAGREGLVDTAVKTSRSGYLQRCLMKHLEDLKVGYDMTVRDSGGNIVQFLYGEDGIDPMSSATLRGESNQMSFMARNNQALVCKYNIDDQYFERGLTVEPSIDYHRNVQKVKECLDALKTQPLEKCLKVSSIVYARKKVNNLSSWSPSNVMKKMFIAEVIKVRINDDEKYTFDLKYEDGSVEKKVPVYINIKPKSNSASFSDVLYGHGNKSNIPFYLITVRLPDPIMSVLGLGSNVGTVSEKVQDAIMSYIEANPDGVITSTTSNSTVDPQSFELLVWVKYMRSLACPGEAVGCVAAQSIGEPSTQMTLNTFHLAGHGGANVTLGIPRLREIIMTASKSQKTPTTLIPINPLLHKSSSSSMAAARLLARKLGRLPLSTLLSHRQGVQVGEKIELGAGGFWERSYRIILQFENPAIISEAFEISFEAIIKSVKTMFMSKLAYLIKLEQRRAGDRSGGRHDALNQFKSMGGGAGDEIGGIAKRGRSGDEDGEKDESRDDDEGANDEDATEKKRGKGYEPALDSDDDDADDLDSDEEKDGKTERGGYDDDDKEETDGAGESSDTNSDDDKPASKITKSTVPKNDSDIEDNSSEEDESSESDSDMKLKTKKQVKFTSSTKVLAISSVTKKKQSLSAPSTPNSAVKKSNKKEQKATYSYDINKGDGLICNEETGLIEFKLSFPSQARRLLMVQLVEKSAASTTVRATKKITNAYAVQHEFEGVNGSKVKGAAVQTEGVNFEAVWSLPSSLVVHNDVKSNDIYSILCYYGIEAARQSIVSEINGVFGVYGIDVDPRHLSLIADFMTRTGSYHAMNRIGMNENSSTLLQMSFETTCTFLLKAAQEGRFDTQESPSSRIVTGSVPKIGTGCFDVMVPFEG